MVMRAFFDESGMDPHKDSALVVGGFLGTVDDWESISNAWDICLRQSPEIEYFKSDEAAHLDGQFKRFSSQAAESKKNALAKIIGDSTLQGFCATVNYGWFEGRDPGSTKGKFGTRPYDWGFLTATSGVLQYMKDVHADEKVDFIFDERTELRLCIAHFNELKAMEDCPWSEILSRSGTCTQETDTRVLALQMADLLCGEFSSMGNRGDKASDAWRSLTAKNGIARIPCDMPPAIPYLIAMQGMRKNIIDSTGEYLRRSKNESESSASLLKEFDRIVESKIFFDAALNVLRQMHEADPEYRRFTERFKK
jgi:hypothetical protein